MTKPKLIRITTVPISLDKLLGKQLSWMQRHFSLTALSADEKELQRISDKYGIKWFHVELTRSITPIKDLKALWKLYCFFRKEKPEIVHTHTPKAGLIGMMAAYLARVPVRMHTVAGMPLLEAKGIKRMLLDMTEKLTYYCAHRVYPNSFVMRDIILRERFVPAAKLKVIGNGSSNGVDLDYFNPDIYAERDKVALRRQLGLSINDFVFIFVGRLVGDKGINELVSAFTSLWQNEALLIENRPKLLLVGAMETEFDPLKPETVVEIHRNPNIVSAGYQDDVRPFLAIANSLAFPSYREGFPNVVMQAGAMGLPAIVTDINGCNEIVVEGKNGTIIPVKDRQALELAMRKILTDHNWRMKIKENSRSMIASRYDQQLVWESLYREYNHLLSGKDYDLKDDTLQ